MIRTVWKFEARFPATGGAFSISMPHRAEIVHVGLDHKDELPVIWAVVDRTLPTEERHFAAVWTGERLPDLRLHYIGTVCVERVGALVFHIFEALS
jgi:hypothetical protein